MEANQSKRELHFFKMHGCGNDYIYFDCFEQDIDDPEALSIKLSDRHFSIGGDGIVLICPSDVADAKMRMFNADGSEGKMCGNAIRCVGKYMHDIRKLDKDEVAIETLSGIKYLKLRIKDGAATSAQVDMGKAILEPEKIPVSLDGEKIVNRTAKIGDKDYNITCVSMGNPHCIVYVDDVAGLNLPLIGPTFESAPIFPERINTEFIKVIDEHTLEMRVWERGSGETLACGTGACASVAASVLNGFCNYDEPVTVRLIGGELSIRYMKDGTVFMTGPASIAFEGKVNYEV